MFDFRPVIFICGILLTGLSVLMTLPGIVDWLKGDSDWLAFMQAAAVTLFVGGGMMLTSRTVLRRLNLRQAFAFTTLSWLIVAIFASLPFLFSRMDMSLTDAFFESMSGITTTGATVIAKLEAAPPGILLWRAMLQWLGGIGIIVFALAILPILKVGGMQLFRTEGFDTPEKVLPRAAQLAAGIGGVYIGFTIIAFFALWGAGMSMFEAVCHAMTAIATGGFSTRDASIGAYSSDLIHWIIIACMIVGSLPFVYYIDALRGSTRPLLRDSQVRWFLTIITCSVLICFCWLHFVRGDAFDSALVESSFNIVSIMTGTGYTNADYDKWGSFPVVLLLTLMFVGGCAGSTTCGIKIFRFQVAYQVGRAQIRRLMQPNGVFLPTFNRRPIADDVASSVMAFFFLFVASFAVLALVLSLYGLDFATALSGAASSIANVGPGFGELIGATGNFATLPDGAKWASATGMLIGRLEVFSVFVLLMPSFWRA